MTDPAQDALWMENPIFAAAGEAVCHDLAATYPTQSHPAGMVLIEMGAPADQVFVVLSGTVRIYQQAADGREVLVKLLKSPCVFSDLEMLAGMSMLKNVAAVDETQLASIPAQAYLDFLVQHPAAMLAHLQQMAGAFCVAVRNQRQLFANIEQRMSNLFLSYADFYGRPQEEGEVIEKNLTQQEIAQCLGATRRSVAQVLSDWTRKGTVSKSGSYFVIKQRDKLEELAAAVRGSLCFQMGMPLGQLDQKEQLRFAELEIINGPGSLPGRRYTVEGEILIGKTAPCQLLLPDDLVSVLHCRVFRGSTGGRFWIEDLGSDNGTRVNGKPINRSVLRGDEVIEVGSIQLRFRLQNRTE